MKVRQKMNDLPFDISEFIKKEEPVISTENIEDENIEKEEAPELEVQQVVVQELAADKAALAEDYEKLNLHTKVVEGELEQARKEVGELQKELQILKEKLEEVNAALTSTQAKCEQKEAELAAQQAKELDLQERNPNALALLDRDVELPDRFPGETRDHVLEVIKKARDKAEAEGRVRCAQLLEGVLVANDSNGNLAKRRAALEKFFNENHNLMTGAVMAELDRCGISYKKGEEYLLPSEILHRTY